MKSLGSITLGLTLLLRVVHSPAAVVSNLNDNGPGSLRAALAEGGSIEFSVTGTIVLTSGELVINHATSIAGPGAEFLTLARSADPGTPAFRVLRVAAAPVMISGVTIQNGRLDTNPANGAGILNEGSLTLSNCNVRNNRALEQVARGGGLFNADHATLTLNRCVLAENVVVGDHASGGGLYAFGTITALDSTFRGNRCEGWFSQGGGLNVDYYGSAAVVRATFSGNAASGTNAQGGGIYNFGRLEIVNSTLSGNSAGDTGGGIQADWLAPATAVRNCTVSDNRGKAGAGLCTGGPGLSAPRGALADSIIVGNAPDDLAIGGILVSSGHNSLGQISGGFFVPAAGDQLAVSADALKLGPLVNNGGPTPTRALLPGSLAIDAGNPTSFPERDQRGVPRPFGIRPDIGAFESNVPPPPVVTVVATQPNTIEAGPTVDPTPGVFTFYRTGATNEPLRVFFRLSGTASNGVDYLALSNSVVIPAGASSAMLLVRARFDLLAEETETVVLRLETPECWGVYPPPPGCYSVGTPLEAVVKITNFNVPENRAPQVQINTPSPGQWLSAGSPIPLHAYAEDPEDGYELLVEFFAGDHRLGVGTFVATACPSPHCPSFLLIWSNAPPGVHVLTARATDQAGQTTVSSPVEIVVYDAALSLVTIRATDASAAEAGDPGEFTVTREGNLDSTLLVFYSLGGSAANGVDYASLSNSVLLAAGVTSAKIAVTPINDLLPETNEAVELRLLPAPFYVFPYLIGSPSNAVVTIADNDLPGPKPVVTIEAGDATASEFNLDPGHFRINRTGPTNSALSVYLAYSGTASNGVDYTLATNRVVIPIGSPFVFLSVKPIDDLLFEGSEAVVATLRYPPGIETTPPPYVIGSPSNATVTILENDPPGTNVWPIVRLGTPTNEAVFTAPANIRLCTMPSDRDGYVATVEFFEGTNSLAWYTNPCVPPHCINVRAQDYCFTWSNVPPGSYVFTAKATDNDGDSSSSEPIHVTVLPPPTLKPVVTIEANDATAAELHGNPGQFKVRRTGATNEPLSIYLAISGTASNGVDYARVTNRVIFPAGRTVVELSVLPMDDNLAEGSETVIATLYHPPIAPPGFSPYVIGSPSNAVVTILDNDLTEPPFQPAVVSIEATDPEARETGMLTVLEPGEFTLRRRGNTNVTLHVGLLISGTASNGVDYIAISNVVTIPAGVTSVKRPVYPINDNQAENMETVRLTIEPPVCIAIYPPPPECYEVGLPAMATVTIYDPPGPTPVPVVSITARDPVASEGTNCFRWVGWTNPPAGTNFCGTNTATFVVRREGGTNAALTVPYTVSGTASNGVDFTALTGSVTLAPGARSAEIVIMPVDDALVERIETIRLTLLSPPVRPDELPTYALGRMFRAGAILVDNDQPRPPSGTLPDRTFHLTRPGANGAWFRIESSTDLLHWSALSTNQVTDGALHFVDPETEHLPSRFYRAVPETNPPTD